jgi:hypothetical protein
LDEKDIKNWWVNNFVTPDPKPKWSIGENSCSDVARRALNEGVSVLNPCYTSLSNTHGAWTPMEVADYAQCLKDWCENKSTGDVHDLTWGYASQMVGGNNPLYVPVKDVVRKGDIIGHYLKLW